MEQRQPISTYNFPMSYPMVGSVIPGPLLKYPISKIVSNIDFSSAVLHRFKPIEVVKKFPTMNQPQGKGHPMIEKLRELLQKSGEAQMREGYTRVRENLSWRGTPMQSGPSIWGV